MFEKTKCTRCGLCSKACPAYEATKKVYMTPRAKNIVLDKYIEGDIDDLDMQYFYDYCSGCEKCQEVCPIDEGFDVRKARKIAIAKGYTPPGSLEMIENIDKYGNPFGEISSQEWPPDKMYCC